MELEIFLVMRRINGEVTCFPSFFYNMATGIYRVGSASTPS